MRFLFQAFEREVRHRGGPLSSELDNVFDKLRTPGAPKPRPTFDLSKGAAKHPKKPKAPKKWQVPKTALPANPKAARPGPPKARIPAPSARKLAPPKPRKDGASRPRKTKSAKIYRERLPARNFVLKKLSWSPWKLAMTHTKAPDASWHWALHSKTRNAYRLDKPFPDTSKPAVYELSIQKKKGGKRFVVFTTCTKGFSRVFWDTKFFGTKVNFMRELRHYSEHNCDFFLRRALLPRSHTVKVDGKKIALKKPEDYRKLLNKQYNYAWRPQGSMRIPRRLFS